MVILDTNVVSEPLRTGCSLKVIRWLDNQEISHLYLTAVNVAELLMGIALLPGGKRKTALGNGLLLLIERHIENRILAFDAKAARLYASLASRAQKRGVITSFADGQIAAIAAAHGFAVATRDEEPFKAMGIRVVNPWL